MSFLSKFVSNLTGALKAASRIVVVGCMSVLLSACVGSELSNEGVFGSKEQALNPFDVAALGLSNQEFVPNAAPNTLPSDAVQNPATAQVSTERTEDGALPIETAQTPRTSPSAAGDTSNLTALATDQSAQSASLMALQPTTPALAAPAPAEPKKQNFFTKLISPLAGERPPKKVANPPKPRVQLAAATSAGTPLTDLFTVPNGKLGKSDQAVLASVAGLGGGLASNGLIRQHKAVSVKCFKPDLMRLLRKVEKHYGKKVIVTSGYRSAKENRRAGGARNSRHVYCDGADIQIKGVTKWQLAKFLRTLPNRGGVGTYCHTQSVHIDTFKVRDWNWRCRKRKKRKG